MINYHNHTVFCGHASGSMDEYILRAIENGITDFGFSDHAPVPENIREGISMSPEDLETYLSLIGGLKERYKGRIAVKSGLEVDFPVFETFKTEYFTDPRIDYIIGSVHYMDGWGFDNPSEVSRYNERDIDDIYTDYYTLVESLVEARFCDFIGHFDLIKKFGHRASKDMADVIRRIAKKMCAYDIAVEINTSGLRKPVREIYPSDEIIKIFFEENVALTLGSDSHSPDDVCSGYREAIEKIKKCRL